MPAPYGSGYGGSAPSTEEPSAPAFSIGRLLAAFNRYKWLMLGIVMLGTVGGVVASRLVKPKYSVRATIWVSSETPLEEGGGPIRSRELLNSGAWTELLKSPRIVDAVVMKHSLFVTPKDAPDSVALRRFTIADRFAPGEYELQLDGKSGRYALVTVGGATVDRGAIGDSIGRPVGFRWAPTPQELRVSSGERTIRFTVATPRETSLTLIQRLGNRLQEKSNFLWLTMEDENPTQAAAILNTWMREYVAVAGELKKQNLVSFASILGDQLSSAERSLRDAEAALEGFRVNTVTLPSEGAPVAAGLEMTRDPVMGAYFERKIEQDNLRIDREALEKLIARAKGDAKVLEEAMLIPSASQGPQGQALRNAFEDLAKKQAALATARQTFTDEFKTVKDLIEAVREAEARIPAVVNETLARLREREAATERRLASQTTDLRQIPTRTIEEMRRRRNVEVAAQLYGTLQQRHASARLAEASANPDVRILDSAVAPLRPNKDTSMTLIFMGVLGSLGLAAGAALLLDKLDGRVRYPEHASRDLGLHVVGAVPSLPKNGSDDANAESVVQVLESFRTIRLSLSHALAAGPHSVAVTSAGPDEGKSLVCSNLALSFAEAGFRTILVDGDTRRGGLHSVFGAPMKSGLTDFLAGDAPIEAILHPTSHALLRLVPRGTRLRRGPELLTSPLMVRLVEELRARADLVIFDTPPLAAGIDAFAIGTAASHTLMVLRLGKTDKRLASAKLELMDRLPVRMVGAVLNDVTLKGEYQYYSYLEGYAVDSDQESEARGQLVSAD